MLSKKDATIKHIQAVIKTLVNARDVISKGWTKGTMARTGNNKAVQPDNEFACKFCSVGAIRRVEPLNDSIRSAASYRLSNVMDGSVVVTNDCPKTKHEHVLMSFDFAILQAKDDLKAAQKATK